MQTLEVLKTLITYPTITPKECGIYEFIKAFLPDFEVLELNKNNVKNLFLYKQFQGEGERRDLCFGGHIDVVPPGDGWEAFVPVVRGEYLYGRGAQDMKGGVAAFLCAIKEFCESKTHSFNGILSILLTSDEEGEAIYGSKHTLQSLKEKNLLPHFAIVAEPTSVNTFGDMIKIGRRGSINGVLKIQGKQGHVAYPNKCINPVEIIAPILSKIAGYNLDSGNDSFEPSKIVITDIRGGLEVVNVTPDDLRIMFNVRNSTQTSLEDLKQYLQDLLKHIPHTLELKQSSKPFLTNPNNSLVAKVVQSLQTTLQITPTLSTSGGTSDARYFAEYGVDVVECGVCNDRIHAINERVKISEVENLKNVFVSLLKEF
ncbi:succinyl-diaminopimelate desuccinylase [Helicobacter apodemus]|uniref:Succinyl-diaminopimelate desuccinylase n=1 Tax=Helicobacter apodemus TaxID=135569 RepID=A0A4U8UI06_9HELI|nr:succinyl-diaminopimelate desuccinylase [Helicobacter apodemus]TLE15521.1 succinyl-diaminopimelate desuccinylase [Helicobacter apodemus]